MEVRGRDNGLSQRKIQSYTQRSVIAVSGCITQKTLSESDLDHGSIQLMNGLMDMESGHVWPVWSSLMGH